MKEREDMMNKIGCGELVKREGTFGGGEQGRDMREKLKLKGRKGRA